ncbi:MAG TPA: hypothetical protein VNK04_23495 [Gemmataceae bacterium]|nr:hypothetical protein [Gemmataceae bacterium]
MTRVRCILSASLAVLLLVGGPALADGKNAREVASFGTLRSATPEAARSQALDWLKSVGKTDDATLNEFHRIWAETSDRPVLDRVADTLALGSEQARQLLAEARDPNAPPPTKVPDLLKDTKQPIFFRANLALAYAKALSHRRIYEEALDSLRTVRPEQVVDPAAYLFHKAVAEHARSLKPQAEETIARLLDDVVDAPERYKMVAVLMHFDMMSWRDKDLGAIARKMSDVERRLELARGGPQTQKTQKEIVDRLDELIKELENRQKNPQANGGACPSGGQQPGGQPGNTNQPNSPQQDSIGGQNSGPGNVDPKKFKEIAEVWGKLPEKERAQALRELTRDMPPRYREVIENYFKNLAKNNPPPGN